MDISTLTLWLNESISLAYYLQDENIHLPDKTVLEINEIQIVAKTPTDHKVTSIKGFRDLQLDVTTWIRVQLKLYNSWKDYYVVP